MEPGLHDRGLIHEDGKIVGICFGADFTTEHQGGHGSLKSAFGIPPGITREVRGIAARTVTKTPPHLGFFQFGPTTYLLCFRGLDQLHEKHLTAEFFDRILHVRNDSKFWTAWDESSFGARMRDDKDGDLERIYNALRSNDAAMFQLGGMWLGPGLYICIKSSVPQKVRDCFEEGDKSRLDLIDAFNASGIEERVKASGKRYFALSPRWTNDAHTEFRIWLNPWDQQIYQAGWYTIEQLDQWIRDEGPVIKQKTVSA